MKMNYPFNPDDQYRPLPLKTLIGACVLSLGLWAGVLKWVLPTILGFMK